MFRSLVILELASLLVLGADQQPYPALDLAARRGDVAAIRELLAGGENINTRDASGVTPLMTAVLCGSPQTSSYLISHGADVNVRQSPGGPTALSYAVCAGRDDLAALLLKSGARADLRYSEDQTILHLAARSGNVRSVNLLLSFHAVLNAVDENQNTPLEDAISLSREPKSMVEALLGHGADVRRLHADGRGPLHAACIRGRSELIPLLLAAGAPPSSKDLSGQTPLDLALDYKNKAVVATLLRSSVAYPSLRTAFSEAMERACQRARTETVSLLLDAGWDVNQATVAGSSYLNDAALHGQLKLVRLLLDRHASIDARNQNGGTPLHDAALSGNVEVIALLLDRGSPVNSRESVSGATPLMLAASLDHTRAVSLLLARGADPLLKDRAGRTALARALESHNAELVRLLRPALPAASSS